MSASAVQRAYDWIRSGVARGDLTPGSFVEESDVAIAIGVSRTPVREAFHRLSGERYLDLVPRRGAQVRQLSSRDVAEIYDARRVLESHAAEEVCRRGIVLGDDVDSVLDRMDGFASVTDYNAALEVSDLDRQFHLSYVRAEGNQLLLQLYDSLWPLHERVTLSHARMITPSGLALIKSQHREILAAVRDRDSDRAVAAIETHLRPPPGSTWLPRG